MAIAHTGKPPKPSTSFFCFKFASFLDMHIIDSLFETMISFWLFTYLGRKLNISKAHIHQYFVLHTKITRLESIFAQYWSGLKCAGTGQKDKKKMCLAAQSIAPSSPIQALFISFGKAWQGAMNK